MKLSDEEKKLSRRSSSNFDLEELRREAEEMRDLKNAESELKISSCLKKKI